MLWCGEVGPRLPRPVAAIAFIAIVVTLLIQATTTTHWSAARLGLLEVGKRIG